MKWEQLSPFTDLFSRRFDLILILNWQVFWLTSLLNRLPKAPLNLPKGEKLTPKRKEAKVSVAECCSKRCPKPPLWGGWWGYEVYSCGYSSGITPDSLFRLTSEIGSKSPRRVKCRKFLKEFLKKPIFSEKEELHI